MMTSGLSPINRALNLIPKRAEQRQADSLRDTFVDSGVAAPLEAIDSQVLYGRRGTGKTHAFRYLETRARSDGNLAIYVDLRTIGSPDGLFNGDTVAATERAARLLVDLLRQVHESILEAVLNDDELLSSGSFVAKIDALADAISTVHVDGSIEVSTEREVTSSSGSQGSVRATIGPNPSINAELGATTGDGARAASRETRSGRERTRINFTEVAYALRGLASALHTRRIWLLLDEWSSVPRDVQPYLAEFLVRCVLPLPRFTVRIAAIEQQTNFRTEIDGGRTIGIELGADVAANVDLDEFMVFEQNEDRSREFFRGLLFKHLTLGVDPSDRVDGLNKESDLVRLGFTDKRAFDELVRAAEGVPRDAINIAAKAALRAGTKQISVGDVRSAARGWFQSDKEAALQDDNARRLLRWIIDNVIRDKRARGFLVNQNAANASLLLPLFDARVLHIVRRGYSAQDEPGERYDVYVIDYGAYVDLIHTRNEPRGTLIAGDASDPSYVEVPTQDLRAIRRAILELDEFVTGTAQLQLPQ